MPKFKKPELHRKVLHLAFVEPLNCIEDRVSDSLNALVKRLVYLGQISCRCAPACFGVRSQKFRQMPVNERSDRRAI